MCLYILYIHNYLFFNYFPLATLMLQGSYNKTNTTSAKLHFILQFWQPYHMKTDWTRTPRTPAFWGYPLPHHNYPYHLVLLDPKSKEDKVKVTNSKNSPKFQNFKQAVHPKHLLKLLDKMCKYEMDPTSIVENTERTGFCKQTDRWTRWNQYTPLSTSLKLGV